MRITPAQRQIIRESVAAHFGTGARVWLFGSRVDDDARGGDIDLYIEAQLSAEEALKSELKFSADLQHRLGEQRIDIVVHREGEPLRPIDEVARRMGVAL